MIMYHLNFQHLVESSNKDFEAVTNLIAKVKKDCQPFIKLATSGPSHMGATFFYRGMRNKPVVGVYHSRKDRKPKDTHPLWDQLINLTLKDNGVIPRSQGVFAFTNEFKSMEFGPSYYIFPIGKFDFYYIDGIEDITYDLSLGSGRQEFSEMPNDFLDIWMKNAKRAKSAQNFIDLWQDSIMDYEDEGGDLFNFGEELDATEEKMQKIRGLGRDIIKNRLPDSGGQEIVINCDKYYYLNAKLYNKLWNEITDVNQQDKLNIV